MRAGNVLKLNSEEFGVIQKLLQLPAEAQAAARQLMQQFDIRCLCITQGDRGSVLCSTSERIEWGPEHQAVHEVVDTVGAGDAYAAVLAFGLLEHWPLATSAARASQFAAAICTISGAIPEQQHFYAQHAPWLRASA